MSDPHTPSPEAGASPTGPAPAGPGGTGASASGARTEGAPDLFAATAEWPAKAVGAIDLVVDTVNDRAVRPVILGARAVVFGLLIAVIGMVVLVLGSVGLIRLLDVYVFPGRVWASYAVLGALFSIVGLWAWSQRSTPARSARS